MKPTETAIAMCNCPEIQAKARWEVGEMTDKGVIIDLYVLKSIWFKVTTDNISYSHYSKADLTWLPTRYGEVEGWLKEVSYRVLSPLWFYGIERYYDIPRRFKIFHGDKPEGSEPFCAPTLIEALLKLFMWVEHGKEWKEEKWNQLKQP